MTVCRSTGSILRETTGRVQNPTTRAATLPEAAGEGSKMKSREGKHNGREEATFGPEKQPDWGDPIGRKQGVNTPSSISFFSLIYSYPSLIGQDQGGLIHVVQAGQPPGQRRGRKRNSGEAKEDTCHSKKKKGRHTECNASMHQNLSISIFLYPCIF